MRSARTAIATLVLILVALPFALLGVAWLYEGAIVRVYESELQQVVDLAADKPAAEWPALAEKHGVWLRRIRDGAVVDDSGTSGLATFNSTIGGAVERVLALFSANTPFEPLAKVDLEPMGDREEIAAALAGQKATASRATETGQTVVVSVAQRLEDGSVLLAQRASHRGVRQLLLARRQLAKLVLYQLVFALVAALVLARWLVTPLERLTARAHAYPAQDIADPRLLSRRDEVGQLARAFAGVTHELEQRRQETVDLAADVAHELKNPLAAISAASELIASTKDASVEKRAGVHQVIENAVERLRDTTDALLSLVRLESTLASTPRDALDYASWLDALLDSYRSDPQHAGVTFECEAAGLGTVHVAAEAWASLLRNLIDNARVQPSTSPRVRVRARLEGAQILTDVTDFGPGVSPGNRDKIFERFFTARPPDVPRGTGLGLAIVRTVAEAHGGTAVLLPQALGEGATFRVSIPSVGPAATRLPHEVLKRSSSPPR